MSEDAKWYEGLDESFTSNKMVTEAPDLNTFVKSALDNQAFIGSSIRIPGEDASEETVAAFHDKLMQSVPGLVRMPAEDDAEAMAQLFTRMGKPKEAKDYDMPELPGANEAEVAALRELALKANLPKDSLKTFMEGMAEMRNNEITQGKAAKDAAHQALKDEWGRAYEERMGQAEAVIKEFMPDVEIPVDQMDTGILKGFAKIAQQMGAEGMEFSNQPPTSSGHMTPEEARSQINEIMGNQDHAYWKAGDPGHADAVKKVVKLMAYANPQASTSMDSARANADLAALQQTGS